MVCPWCRADVDAGRTFCSACGRSLTPTEAGGSVPSPPWNQPGWGPPGPPATSAPFAPSAPGVPTRSTGIVAIVAIGVVLVLLIVGVIFVGAVNDEGNPVTTPASGVLPSSTPPEVGDHFHIAYGIYACDHFLPALNDFGPDEIGIHTHGDGIIHVHPFYETAAGANATLFVFARQVGLHVTDRLVTVQDVLTQRMVSLGEGGECNGRPGHLSVREWVVDEPSAPPVTFTSDLAAIPLDRDRVAMTIAFVAEGDDIPQPPSVPYLDRLSDVVPATPTIPSPPTTPVTPTTI